MRDLLQGLIDCLHRNAPVVFTALVETRGSTPQKPGAAMLVFPDGSQAGTLGGGCVEAEVKRNALQLLDRGERQIVSFKLDSNYGWDDGLICGGRMTMLLDPLTGADDAPYFESLRDAIIAGNGCTEAVVFDVEQAGQGMPADRYLIDAQRQVVASRCQGEMPSKLLDYVKPIAARPRSYVEQGVSYLTHLQRCRLVIVGGGHVGQQVAELAGEVDFDVWVVDDREQYCNAERFPRAKRLIVGDIETSLAGLDIDADTMCIIVTRGHRHDEQALHQLAETPARYVGMIGSKRKIKLIFADLLREGISREALSRVFAPIGLDIGSQTVPEIAVSILAELIACRNLGRETALLNRPRLIDEVADER